jgi:hypothetical protein
MSSTVMTPFKREEEARPWLILSNHEGRPFHGEQYIAVTLTTKSWMDDLIEIPEKNWHRGGTPDESRIDWQLLITGVPHSETTSRLDAGCFCQKNHQIAVDLDDMKMNRCPC